MSSDDVRMMMNNDALSRIVLYSFTDLAGTVYHLSTFIDAVITNGQVGNNFHKHRLVK